MSAPTSHCFNECGVTTLAPQTPHLAPSAWISYPRAFSLRCVVSKMAAPRYETVVRLVCIVLNSETHIEGNGPDRDTLPSYP